MPRKAFLRVLILSTILQLSLPPSAVASMYFSPGLKQVKDGTAEGLTLSVWLRLAECPRGPIISLEDDNVWMVVGCQQSTAKIQWISFSTQSFWIFFLCDCLIFDASEDFQNSKKFCNQWSIISQPLVIGGPTYFSQIFFLLHRKAFDACSNAFEPFQNKKNLENFLWRWLSVTNHQ